jgi:hypothetical protein
MNRLGRAHRRSLYAVGGALLLSGLAWAVLHYLPRRLGIDEQLARGDAALLMKLHGAAAMLALLLLGALRVRHLVHGWKLARNRWTGVSLAAATATLIVSGYLLYYLGDEALRAYASWIHLAVGAFLPMPIALHVLRGRVDRARSSRAQGFFQRGRTHETSL